MIGGSSVTLGTFPLLKIEIQTLAVLRYTNRKIEEPHARIKAHTDAGRAALPSSSCADLRTSQAVDVLR